MSTPLQALEFWRFELRQQCRQPAFWLSLLACVAVGVSLVATELGLLEATSGRVARAAPYAIAHNLAGLSGVGMVVVMIAVARAALRDHAARSTELIFSKPVRPAAYLAGRFAAGYGAALIAVCAGALAMATTQLVLDWRAGDVGAFAFGPYLYGGLLLVAPNLLLVGALVFLLALWTRSMGATFLGLLPIVIGQDVAEALPVATFGHRLPALLDPLGLAALRDASRGWSLQQYAAELPALRGNLLANRSIWLAVSLLALTCARLVHRAREQRVMRGAGKRREHALAPPEAGGQRPDAERQKPEARRQESVAGTQRAEAGSPPAATAARAVPRFGWSTDARQLLATLRFEFARMARGLAWLTILACGLAMVAYSMYLGGRVMGVRSLPAVQAIALSVGRASTMTMILLVVLCTGEALWRERSTRMGLCLDAYPSRDGVRMAGKVGAIALLVAVTLSLHALLAWRLQAELSGSSAPAGAVAFIVLHELLGVGQIAAAALFVQALAGSRTSGYAAVGVVLAARMGLRMLGHEGPLYSIAGARLPFASEMDGWGHELPRLAWTQAYGLALALLLLLLTTRLLPRGERLGWRARLTRLHAGSGAGFAALVGSVALALLVSGGVLWKQSLARGQGWTQAGLERSFATYERELGAWRERPRPEVTRILGDLELDGARRKLRLRGRYELLNSGPQAIDELLFGHDLDWQLRGLQLAADEPGAAAAFAQLVARERAGESAAAGLSTAAQPVLPGAWLVSLEPPLASGARRWLDFELEFDVPGFGPRPADRWLRTNGSFLLGGTGTHSFFRGSQAFPTIGYDPAKELQETRARARQGLPAWAGLPSPEDYLACNSGEAAVGARGAALGSSDWAEVELWIHTDADQHVLAPGALLEHRVEAGRALHHYRTSRPIQAFFPIVSGRYELARAQHGAVELEVLYDEQHGARVEHLLWAMQRSLEIFEEHWGAYPHATLRLAEIPSAHPFAVSLPGGTLAFAETMAFTCPHGAGAALEFALEAGRGSAADVDPILWIVAHEVAHQWWDCEVVAAHALGASFVSESLAQYGSLRVSQAVYGDVLTRRMALYNRELYVSGRARADRAEPPLVRVDDQAHLHYGKGFVAFRALSQRFGFEPLDRALHELVLEFAGAGGRPLTSIQLLDELRRCLPAEAERALRELFEEVCFVDGRLRSARAWTGAQGRQQLLVEASVSETRVNAAGQEDTRPYAGPLECELRFEDGATQLVEVEVVDGELRLEDAFEGRPVAVELDPRLLHIDRDLVDNEMDVTWTKP